MRKYKETQDDIIIAVGESLTNGETILDSEYEEILREIKNKPQAQDSYDYRLRTDLTWELYKLPKGEEESE